MATSIFDTFGTLADRTSDMFDTASSDLSNILGDVNNLKGRASVPAASPSPFPAIPSKPASNSTGAGTIFLYALGALLAFLVLKRLKVL